MRAPNILVFDSGLGGLTVLDEIIKLRPHANYLYAADDAAFPYGRLGEDRVVARVDAVMRELVDAEQPDIVVIACNTASTLVLPHLRAAWPDLPFVGTVPAIKPAAEQSLSRVITVLATPGTVARDYTQGLIRDHASHCHVTLIGSENLASIAESFMHGVTPDESVLVTELNPCFVQYEDRRTDQIVLACTHYPLLLPHFLQLAGVKTGWPVNFIDPAPAIARRTDHLLSGRGFTHNAAHGANAYQAFFSSGKVPDAALSAILRRYGLTQIRPGALPFAE